MESSTFKTLNVGCTFEHGSSLFNKYTDWDAAVKRSEETLSTQKHKDKIKYLVKAIQHIDLTSLVGNYTKEVIQSLCHKAANPLPNDVITAIRKHLEPDMSGQVTVAAVVVYPTRVDDCRNVLRPNHADINIASVAGGFPAGQTTLPVKKLEIREAVLSGATEIDAVINRCNALDGDWEEVYREVKHMKEVCSEVACLKTILETGQLGSLDNVYKASLSAMLAGADFIKTSTGKESVNATIPVGIVMMTAIKDYFDLTGYKVGFKPAGGIKTAKDALTWFALVKSLLGDEWLTPELFRFGASSLLDNIVKELCEMTTGSSSGTQDSGDSVAIVDNQY